MAFSAPLSADSCPEAWPYLNQAALRSSRSRRVYLTCHWFRNDAGASCIPLLTCQLHCGLIAHEELIAELGSVLLDRWLEIGCDLAN